MSENDKIIQISNYETYFLFWTPMNIPLLNDIVIIFGLSVVVLYVFSRLKLPTIVGFLLTGVLAGPHGFALVSAAGEVEILAEIGIVLLLFTIGIEFSLKNLLKIKRVALIAGPLQVALTAAACALISRRFGFTLGEATFIGFLISLSSTAVVLKLLQERAEVDSPYGRVTLGILIFQDIIIVVMMLMTPVLAGKLGVGGQSAFLLVAKAGLIISLVIAGANWIVPFVLYQITRTRSRELFLMSIIVIGFSVAWLTSTMGLSLALGAFLAGLIISESEYSVQALGNILPFRVVFTSFFFVSVGMLLDVGVVLREPALILAVVLSVLFLKSILAGISAAVLGFPLRTSILAGLALSQVGEFSFILSKAGIESGLLTEHIYQLFIAVSVVTMALTPFVMGVAPRLVHSALRLPLPPGVRSRLSRAAPRPGAGKRDHLVIIGYGVNGKNLARAAKSGGIPYAIIEMNPQTVREERTRGEPIMYGDATQETVLEHAGIREARVAAVAINDPAATRAITEACRRLNARLYLVVRTRYVEELKPLFDLGADEVIPEEFETSIEIFTRVLRQYRIPTSMIERFVSEIRSDSYEMFRNLAKRAVTIGELKLHLPDVEMEQIEVSPNSPILGKTLTDLDLRKNFRVTLLAIRRGDRVLANPDEHGPIHAGDELIIIGTPENVSEAAALLRPFEPPGSPDRENEKR